MLSKKSLNFKYTRHKISVPLAISTFFFLMFQIIKNKNENKYSRADVGPRTAWEKISQIFIWSGEIPSPRRTSIDKTNDCAMKSERGALVRGPDPQCSQNGRWYVAGAGQATDTNTFGRCCVENRRQKIWIPLRWQKYLLFFKQKTAYEIMPSLVGSEMCIRDSHNSFSCLKSIFPISNIFVTYISVSYTHLTLPTTPYV